MFKDVLVHLDGSSGDELRLQHAEMLAAGTSGFLTGILSVPLPDLVTIMPMDGGAAAAEIIADLDEEARRNGDRIQQNLSERFSRLSVSNEIRRIEGSPGQLARLAASDARKADLFVLSRPYGGNGAAQSTDLFEAVLFESGRGLYVVPPERRPPDAIRRVLVAWRDTREAARALAEAMPFIANATRTEILVIDAEKDGSSQKVTPELDVARHIGRYGTSVEINMRQSGGRPVSEVILEQAHRMPADLIVMGAYGHSRAHEWMLGGATRDMLEMSNLPMVMAH